MKFNKISLAAGLVLAAMPFASFAQSSLTSTIAATTDYSWRGISQSDRDPAFQIGTTYSHSSGFYAGVWASTVDFGPTDPYRTHYETDGFIGYNVDFSDSVNFDVQYNYYGYPDASASEFGELITNTTFLDTYTLTVAYSNDIWATDENGLYYALGADFDLGNDFSLGASVGYSDFSSKAGLEDYTDYSLSLTKSSGPIDFTLGYYGASSKAELNTSNPKNADDRFAFTVTVNIQ